MKSHPTNRKYVLVTAAYNEEAYIGGLISSVISQTLLPVRWIIVSDGSTDRTDEIVKSYSAEYPYIQLHCLTGSHERQFAAQVEAINTGFALLRDSEYDYIGNLDADVSLEPTYFAQLLRRFELDPALGLAGGMIYEQDSGKFKFRKTNNTRSVALAVQLFRRECMESFGGYVPLLYGGPDWHAEVSMRMIGWRVCGFPELKVFHHRPTGAANGLVRYSYLQGKMDFSLGSHPVFEVLKCMRRIPAAPMIVGAVARLTGFVVAYFRGEKRAVGDEFIQFLRSEQKSRLRRALINVSRSARGVVREGRLRGQALE